MKQPEKRRPRLVDRWWVQLLVALWILAIVYVYFGSRISELVQIAGLGP